MPKWPMSVYVCKDCSRPTLFAEDRCCSGFVEDVWVMPVQREAPLSKDCTCSPDVTSVECPEHGW